MGVSRGTPVFVPMEVRLRLMKKEVDMRKSSKRKELEAMVNKSITNQPVGIIQLKMVRESRSLYGTAPFTSPERAVELLKPLLITADREMVIVMSLTTKMEALAVEIVAVGGLDTCCFDTRNIFKHSLLNNAACILCFHNHPSGDPTPSKEDVQITKQLKQVGDILGIRLVDHIIIGEESYFSFKEHGELDDKPPENIA